MLNKLANGLKKSLHLLSITISSKSTYPTMWKRSEMCPINKNSDKQSVISYRPISLLFSVSKVLERLIFDKITTHTFKQLHQNDCGFQPK